MATATEPEAIYSNGKIVTLDAAASTAAAVAVQAGKVLNVGNTGGWERICLSRADHLFLT
jgi:predicted amidohydrolase YtcJ